MLKFPGANSMIQTWICIWSGEEHPREKPKPDLKCSNIWKVKNNAWLVSSTWRNLWMWFHLDASHLTHCGYQERRFPWQEAGTLSPAHRIECLWWKAEDILLALYIPHIFIKKIFGIKKKKNLYRMVWYQGLKVPGELAVQLILQLWRWSPPERRKSPAGGRWVTAWLLLCCTT